jgi:hypothetical protein
LDNLKLKALPYSEGLLRIPLPLAVDCSAEVPSNNNSNNPKGVSSEHLREECSNHSKQDLANKQRLRVEPEVDCLAEDLWEVLQQEVLKVAPLEIQDSELQPHNKIQEVACSHKDRPVNRPWALEDFLATNLLNKLKVLDYLEVVQILLELLARHK